MHMSTALRVKQLIVYLYGFARKATYCVRIRLVRSRRLVHTSTALRVQRLIAYVLTCAIEATCSYEYGFARKAIYASMSFLIASTWR